MKLEPHLMDIYNKLKSHFGFLNWWPAETPFEVVIGAILTQNVAWGNVEKAITNLKEKRLLSLNRLLEASPQIVKSCIRPVGYYNVKYKRLISILKFIRDELSSDITNLRDFELSEARRMLLSVKGVGKETADSILLYAVQFPIFVVDAYTKRSFYRIGVLKSLNMEYDEIQSVFMQNLKKDVSLYNDYHAQIVELSKNYCRKRPICDRCPLFDKCKKVFDER